jgi:mRNA-degrading endonuclease toxin of MazEF toxin-antitoxin module
MKKIFQWEIWWARLPVGYGAHIEIGLRPVLIISNKSTNAYAPTVNAIPLSTNLGKAGPASRVVLSGHNMQKKSIAFCEQLITLDKTCLTEKCGFLWDRTEREQVRRAVAYQLDMSYLPKNHIHLSAGNMTGEVKNEEVNEYVKPDQPAPDEARVH